MALVEELTAIPAEMRAGDSYRWRNTPPPTNTTDHALTWHFVKEGASPVSVEGVEDAGDFTGRLSSGQSSRLEPGFWRWYARARDKATGDMLTVDEGVLQVTPDANTRYEETHPEKMLAAIRAVQLKRQGKAYNSGDIAGTTFDYKSDDELRDAEQHFMSRVNHLRRVREARDRGGSPIAGRLHNRLSA